MPNTHRATHPTARARSAREDSRNTQEIKQDRLARNAARPDPSHLPPDKRVPDTADTSHLAKDDYARANPPQPQQGPSSSELNSLPGAAKDVMIEDQEGPDQTPEKK